MKKMAEILEKKENMCDNKSQVGSEIIFLFYIFRKKKKDYVPNKRVGMKKRQRKKRKWMMMCIRYVVCIILNNVCTVISKYAIYQDKTIYNVAIIAYNNMNKSSNQTYDLNSIICNLNSGLEKLLKSFSLVYVESKLCNTNSSYSLDCFSLVPFFFLSPATLSVIKTIIAMFMQRKTFFLKTELHYQSMRKKNSLANKKKGKLFKKK
ncbi:hypothetical protein RFI_26306, partial [Reticulomyxa filosa]